MGKLKYNIPLDIATASTSHAIKWRNKRTDWEAVVELMRETTRTEETVAQYASFSKAKQDEIKDVGGFVGGRLRGGTVFVKRSQSEVEVKPPYGVRRKGHVEYRQLVALDVDFGSLDVWLDFINLGVAGLVYSTHKHKPTDARLRLVFPLDRAVTPDEYEAIARTVASWLGIDVFDDSTYQPTRMMYYPSTSKNGEYVFDLQDAPIMSADEVLGEMEAPGDPSTWPRSSRVEAVRTHAGTTVEDPTTKEGVVGAFCRSYSIDEAIAEFLEDVYVPCEELGPDRYSYALGSTAGGLVVYDGLHAFSFHATDPAGERLSNAFDLVRLHKFGDLDSKAKPDTEPGKLPSFKAMADFAGGLGPVKKELLGARRASAADYDTLEEHARDWAETADWVAELETEGKKGTVKNTIANVVLILQNDENLAGRLGYNEFEARETAIRALPWDKKGLRYPRPLVDADDAELRLYLERCYGITSRAVIDDGLKVIQRGQSFHPVRNYLDALTWDGEERLDRLFCDLFGLPDTPYIRAVTRKAFTAGVARIYREGCKYDFVLVLVGEQGRGKSTALARMGGAWFSDSVTTVTGKEALESIQGAWIIELGELSSLRKAEVEAVKHFVAKTEDRFRVAYGKRLEYFPRRCVFFGTTNEDDFLRDVTGNRRFWVVNMKGYTGREDVFEYLTPVVVSQLWAEARQRYLDGEPLYLDRELEEVAAEVQERHLEKDDRAGIIGDYLARLLPKNWENLDAFARRTWIMEADNVGTVERQRVCILDIWTECLGRMPEDIRRMDSIELGRIMKTLKGWEAESAPVRMKPWGLQKAYKLVKLSNPEAAYKWDGKNVTKQKRKGYQD